MKPLFAQQVMKMNMVASTHSLIGVKEHNTHISVSFGVGLLFTKHSDMVDKQALCDLCSGNLV